MQVVVGPSTYDVSSRALVIGVIDPALEGTAQCDAARTMARSGADAIEVGDQEDVAPVGDAVDVPVVTPGTVDSVTAEDAAAVAVAIVGGARVVRTHDVHAARRVADVLAAVIDAGHQ